MSSYHSESCGWRSSISQRHNSLQDHVHLHSLTTIMRLTGHGCLLLSCCFNWFHTCDFDRHRKLMTTIIYDLEMGVRGGGGYRVWVCSQTSAFEKGVERWIHIVEADVVGGSMFLGAGPRNAIKIRIKIGKCLLWHCLYISAINLTRLPVRRVSLSLYPDTLLWGPGNMKIVLQALFRWVPW